MVIDKYIKKYEDDIGSDGKILRKCLEKMDKYSPDSIEFKKADVKYCRYMTRLTQCAIPEAVLRAYEKAYNNIKR